MDPRIRIRIRILTKMSLVPTINMASVRVHKVPVIIGLKQKEQLIFVKSFVSLLEHFSESLKKDHLEELIFSELVFIISGMQANRKTSESIDTCLTYTVLTL
jgi:hypothetical protein